MAKFEYMVGIPTVGVRPKFVQIELDLSKEETSPFIGNSIQWHDKRDANPKFWAWRLLHVVNE